MGLDACSGRHTRGRLMGVGVNSRPQAEPYLLALGGLLVVGDPVSRRPVSAAGVSGRHVLGVLARQGPLDMAGLPVPLEARGTGLAWRAHIGRAGPSMSGLLLTKTRHVIYNTQGEAEHSFNYQAGKVACQARRGSVVYLCHPRRHRGRWHKEGEGHGLRLTAATRLGSPEPRAAASVRSA